jgi:NAD(P)-dependent dehydrogenase (short-subunit alcohol dehydrogenase family)
MNWLDFKDSVCVVCGAAGGIGSAIAEDLARAGAHLALIDLDESACAELKLRIEARGGNAEVFGADICDASAVSEAAARCERVLGPCHVLVNVPAISGRPDPIISVSPDKWDKQISVNLNGYLNCSQQFGRQMQKQGRGSIVHVGSIAGEFPQPNSGAYSVTKAGIAMMSRVLALEMAQYGLRSNVVSPGMVRTPLSERFYRDPDLLQRRNAFVPLGKIADPQQIADAVLFLASDRASYITGQNIVVDGGVAQLLMSLFPHQRVS